MYRDLSGQYAKLKTSGRGGCNDSSSLLLTPRIIHGRNTYLSIQLELKFGASRRLKGSFGNKWFLISNGSFLGTQLTSRTLRKCFE